MPIPLSPDYPNQPGNKIDDLESKIKNLETLLTAIDLGNDVVPDNSADPTTLGVQYDFDPNTVGIQRLDSIYYKENGEVNIELVMKDLEVTRKEDLEIRKKSGLTSLEDPNGRLSEIEAKLTGGQQRFNDLTNLLNSLIEGKEYDTDLLTPGIQMVSGLSTALHPNGNQDANLVEQEIIKVVEYEKDLLSAKDFWEKVVDSHINISSKNIKNVTRDDMFYTNTTDGIFGIKRLEELNDWMQKLISGETNDTPPVGLDSIGKFDPNYIRAEIAKVQEDLKIKLNKAKHEKWFPEFKKEIQTWQADLLKTKETTANEIKELEDRLIKGLNDPNSTEDLNTLRQTLYRERASLGEINNEIKFGYKITGNSQALQNIASGFKNDALEEMNRLLKTKEMTQKEIIQLQKDIQSISNDPKMKDKVDILTQDLYRKKALVYQLNQEIKYLKRITTKSLTNNAPLLYIKEELTEKQLTKNHFLKEKKRLEQQIKNLSNNPKMKDRVDALNNQLGLMNQLILQVDFKITYLSEAINKYEPSKKNL